MNHNAKRNHNDALDNIDIIDKLYETIATHKNLKLKMMNSK